MTVVSLIAKRRRAIARHREAGLLRGGRVGPSKTSRVMFGEFDGRLLPFDSDAASAYADLFAARRRAGRPTATLDRMIAAIARCRDAGVVTRDSDGFEECGCDDLTQA